VSDKESGLARGLNVHRDPFISTLKTSMFYQHHDGATHMHGNFISLALTWHFICGAADCYPTGSGIFSCAAERVIVQ
jgi:hypothetical protein